MLRDYEGVVGSDAMEVGKFYVQKGYNETPWLFLRVQRALGNQAPAEMNLYFTGQDLHGVFLTDPMPHEPALALPALDVRIDHKSLFGSPYSSTLRGNSLCISGSDVLFTVSLGKDPYQGTNTFNLASGLQVERPSNWLAFSKWSLVMGEGDDETEMIAYDLPPSPS